MDTNSQKPQIIIVTGLSGAGRNTALNALEDCGYRRINNIPLHLLEQFLRNPGDKHLAIGFGALEPDEYQELLGILIKLNDTVKFDILFMDAEDQVLIRRYSETRRLHPFSHDGSLRDDIKLERKTLTPLTNIASSRIDTSRLSPHDLKASIKRIFKLNDQHEFRIYVQSFSYKMGLSRDVDMVFDCRFLRNPHWDEKLRPMDGRDAKVANYVQKDENYINFKGDIIRLLKYAVPAAQKEGRSYFTIGFGCSGGRHRSVCLAEAIAAELINENWLVTLQHRELT